MPFTLAGLGRAERGPTVVPFRKAPPPVPAARSITDSFVTDAPSTNDDVTRRTNLPIGTREAVPASVHLSATGIVKGGDAPTPLVEAVAFTAQMADVIGELLGVDAFVSMEIALSSGTCVIAREDSGDLLAMQAGHAVDAKTLRGMLGI